MRLKQFIDVKLEEWVLMLTLTVIVLLVFLQVLSRYVFNNSIGWSSELSRYLLIWITWVSASYVIRTGEHIRVTTIINMFKPSVQKVIEVFVIICWAIFALVMAIEGTKVVLNIKLMNQTTSTLGLPMWIVYLAIPVGGSLMIIRLIQQIYFIYRKPNIESGDGL